MNNYKFLFTYLYSSSHLQLKSYLENNSIFKHLLTPALIKRKIVSRKVILDLGGKIKKQKIRSKKKKAE